MTFILRVSEEKGTQTESTDHQQTEDHYIEVETKSEAIEKYMTLAKRYPFLLKFKLYEATEVELPTHIHERAQSESMINNKHIFSASDSKKAEMAFHEKARKSLSDADEFIKILEDSLNRDYEQELKEYKERMKREREGKE